MFIFLVRRRGFGSVLVAFLALPLRESLRGAHGTGVPESQKMVKMGSVWHS